MTNVKNIIMVLIALFLVLSFAPVSAATVENLTDAVVIAEVITPTPVPTLESMAHARVMSDGSMYPNYKVKEFNLKDETPDYSKFGYVKFYLRAGGSALDLNVWLVKANANVTAFDNKYNPDKTDIEGQNKDYILVEILPDGESDLKKLDAGDWIAYIQNGNGGQMEVQKFKIGNGDVTRVPFLGHAVSSVSACVPVYTILDATYCGTTIPAVTHTVNHDAYYTVVGANKICKWWGCYYDGNADKSTCNPYDFKVDNQKYDFQNYGRYTYTFHPAWIETVIDTPAVLGGCANGIPSTIQSVVSQGTTTFLFDNRPSNGGIFGIGGNLLSEIKDPAKGIRKNVNIKYSNGCGSERTIKAMEYDHINLATGSVTPTST